MALSLSRWVLGLGIALLRREVLATSPIREDRAPSLPAFALPEAEAS